MADMVSWVSDQLHELLGLSDRYTAEFLVGLAKKSSSPELFFRKLKDTGAITVNEAVRGFAADLWRKVPHKQLEERPSKAHEREVLTQREKNRSYRLLSDSDEETGSSSLARRRRASRETARPRKRRNIRTEKAAVWESEEEEEEEEEEAKRSKEAGSDEDEWERCALFRNHRRPFRKLVPAQYNGQTRLDCRSLQYVPSHGEMPVIICVNVQLNDAKY